MSNDHTHSSAVSVDEAWIGDWAAEGLAAIEQYLAGHAAFASFLAARGLLDSDDGDVADRR